jgi:hypothetical protein
MEDIPTQTAEEQCACLERDGAGPSVSLKGMRFHTCALPAPVGRDQAQKITGLSPCHCVSLRM